MVNMSERLFCIGVAVIHNLASQVKDSSAVIVKEPPVFLRRCPVKERRKRVSLAPSRNDK
jgi:hypothetical protein